MTGLFELLLAEISLIVFDFFFPIFEGRRKRDQKETK